MLQIQKYGYYGDLDFIILFVGILSLYAIDLMLFTDLSFMFLTRLIMLLYLVYSINLNE